MGMSEEPTPVNQTGPSSWRDVYQLIMDVEERLTKRMDAQSAERRAIGTDVEVRLRVLERAQLVNEQSDKTAKVAVSAFRSTIVVAIAIGSLGVSILSILTR